jgi:hypothetical protein
VTNARSLIKIILLKTSAPKGRPYRFVALSRQMSELKTKWIRQYTIATRTWGAKDFKKR